jgi:hypothetical protein
MKAMAKKMEEGLQGSEEQMEDVKMLRQVLDNLLAFLSQEYAMVQFKDLKRGSPAFNKNIKCNRT